MVSRVTFLFLLYVALLDLREILGYSFQLVSKRDGPSIAQFGVLQGNEKSCPRKTTNLHRACLKRCTKDSDCVSKKKRCLCDGDCGMSCINKNIRCKNLNMKIQNGQVDIQPYNQFEAIAKYSCAEGYVLFGKDTRICQGDETWSGEPPRCVINDTYDAGCPLLDQIENGRVDIEQPNMIGTTAKYTCSPGFHLAGRAVRTCTSEGTWDGKEPSCERDMCSRPPSIRHAFHNAPRDQQMFSAGTEIVYECEKGFNPNGHPRAMCREDGNWSGPRFSCTRRPQKKPANRRPQAIKCPILHSPLNGYMAGDGNTFNTVLKFSCKDGFKVVGSPERRCMSDGQWSGQPARCEEINCGLPGPLYNGYLDGHRKTVGAVFFFRCNVRTTFDGPSFSTQCQENGVWTHPAPKCWGQCQVPSIVNGTVMHGREGVWVDHETFINFRCRDGLVLNNTSDVRCNNGTWTLVPRCIPGNEASSVKDTHHQTKDYYPTEDPRLVYLPKAPCSTSPPYVPNSLRVYIGWKHGDRAKYMCLQGFRLRGDKYVTCQYGRWKGSATCEEIYCPNPGTISNGKIHKKGEIGKFEFKAYIVTIRHGDRLAYECDRSYELLGPSGATCVDGQWSPEERPMCKQSKHPALQKLWKPLEEGPSNY